MATIEQVEKLREKANVSYAEAKEALDKCDGDMLDAILYLEAQGKVKSYQTGGQNRQESANDLDEHEKHDKKGRRAHEYDYYSGKGDCQSVWNKFCLWCKDVFHKGCVNTFEVYRYGEIVICIPVIIFVLLLLCAFWVTLPLLIVGLFFGFKYRFNGPDLTGVDLNKAMDAASEAVRNAGEEIKTAADNRKES